MKKPEKKHYKGNSDTGSAIHSLKWDNYNNAIDEMNAWIDFADIERILTKHIQSVEQDDWDYGIEIIAKAIRNLLKEE